MSPDQIRRRALDILLRVDSGEPLDRLLGRALSRYDDPRDGGLLTELVKGTLQWRGRYDHLIAHFARRRPPGDRRVREILRLALHQLVAMGGVPDYAAIDSSVQLCRVTVGQKPVGFVNGLLRSVQRFLVAERDEPVTAIRALFPDPAGEPIEFLSRYHSLPRWLVERWVARWGEKFAAALCEHHNRPAPVTLHVLPTADLVAVTERLEAESLEPRAGRWHPRALVLGQRVKRPRLRSLLESLPGVIIQDEAAQAVTAWLSERANGPLLDMCAAPGGKVFHMAAIWPGEAVIVALDHSRYRLELLRQSAVRLGDSAKRIEKIGRTVVLADGRYPPVRSQVWGAVLLDGPCSGTGVLRRHPDARWRVHPEQLIANRERLLELAGAAAELLRPGGLLMYATCSLEAEENEEVIAALLTLRTDLEPDPTQAQHYWLPPDTGVDGFFAARLRKRG